MSIGSTSDRTLQSLIHYRPSMLVLALYTISPSSGILIPGFGTPKLVRVSPELPTGGLNVDEASRFDFDEALLPEDSWDGNLDADEFEVDKIIDVRSGRKTR